MMKTVLLLVTGLLLTGSCQNSKKASLYELIKERCYIMKSEVAPAAGTDSIGTIVAAIRLYLEEEKKIPLRIVHKDSLLFQKADGTELEFVLPPATDEWEQYRILLFDPQKNPAIIDLRRGKQQVDRYFR